MAGNTAERWYAEWFNEDYLRVYAHRSAEEARTVADFIAAHVPAVPGGRTLDLGCGAGRHLPYLAAHQETVGLDLSPWLLGVARRRQPEAALARGDMRQLPFRAGTFTLVASLFTSFGYFLEDAENQHVLEEMARVTAPGGRLVLDFLNASQTRVTLIPFERRRVETEWVEQSRRISEDGRFVTKTIRLEGSGREFMECVRLFEAVELVGMLNAAGFEAVELYGDYAGGAWSATSPRAILVGIRGEAGR